MNVFVSVGTTKFDELIGIFSDPEFVRELKFVKKLTIQHGKSTAPILPSPHVVFDYTDKFQEMIDESDLVVSHAAAGTRLDVISAEKPHLMLANRQLHGDHQKEMVDAFNMAENPSVKGFLDPLELKSFLQKLTVKDLKLMQKPVSYPSSQQILDMVQQTMLQKENGTYILLSIFAIILYVNLYVLTIILE
ncbi:N-acetylglucosaminyldiphosphodolichol N-acetylglucosaminyltransferase [Spironucleus salmonicida]|uniref:UDP-N-acetylglucosamine transferase subunit ALG13 n=1 Tax=Spironucleus salmonicida TaxID=348837 RepID=V6M505_9EUKA|nr:N-acetylglucosaminyldiphosphodolichol N-acetylglucosaminyltransferase [Spironucleus salmonicida]|eukprot:EST48439.1 Glycosyltransferase family 28 protein [Spironucleus salmonicida]